MHLNRFIIVSGFIIMGTTLYQLTIPKGTSNVASVQTQAYPVLVGGWIFMMILAIVDLFGGPLATLASGLALVAVVYVLLNSGFLNSIFSQVSSKSSSSSTPARPSGVPAGAVPRLKIS